MGFLKKIVKKVKKGVKKIGKAIKKTFKGFNLKKALKIAAIAGAALVTGGAAVSAFTGGTATGFGGWLMRAGSSVSQFLGPVDFLAKPFEYAGTMLGSGARAITDFTGLTDATQLGNVKDANQAAEILKRTGMTEAEIAGLQQQGEAIAAAQDYVTNYGGAGKYGLSDYAAAKKAAASTVGSTAAVVPPPSSSFLAPGSIAGQVATGVGTSVLSGAAMQYIQGDPDAVGAVGAGLGEERGISLTPLEVAYAQSGIDMRDIYSQLTFGTADPGFLASRYGDLFQQPTLSLGGQ
jgi:hypothetical protein